MTTETETLPAETTTETETPKTETEKTYTEADYKKVASEKKAFEDSVKTLQVKLDKLEAEKKKAAEDDMKATGKDKELLAAKEKELLEAQEKLKEIDILRAEKEDLETATKAELMEGLTKEQKQFCEDKSVKDIRAFVKLVGKSGSVDTDVNGRPVKTGDVKLTNEQKKEAEIMGISDESYFAIQEKRKANLEKNKK